MSEPTVQVNYRADTTTYNTIKTLLDMGVAESMQQLHRDAIAYYKANLKDVLPESNDE